MAQYDQAVTIKINGDNSNFKAAINNTQATLGSLKGIIAKLGLGTALYKGTEQAIKGFSSLESSIAKASTLFGDVQVNTKGLQDQILNLSNATGLTADSIGNSLYNALSAGLPVTQDMGDSMEFLSKSAKLAKAGFTDMDTAVTATAKVMNAYKMSVDDVDQIHNILMATQNLGITTVNELGSALATVTPVAAAFGVSLEDVGSAISVMTKAGTDTATATTQLSGLISELGQQGTTASKALASATKNSEKYKKSMSFTELIKSGVSLSEIMELMQKEADRTGVSMVDLFSNIRAGKGALQIANDLETNAKFMEVLAGDADLVNEAYAKVDQTLSAQAEKLKTKFQNILTEIAHSSNGILNDIVGFANNAVNKMSIAFRKGGISGLASSLMEQLEEELRKFLDEVPEKLAGLITTGMQMVEKLSEGFAQKWPEFTARIAEAMWGVVENLGENLANFHAIGNNIVVNIFNGVVGAFDQLATTLIELAQMMGDIFLSIDWLAVGKDILARIWNGIVTMFDKLKEKIKSLGKVIVDLLKGKSLTEAFDIEFASSFEVGGEDGIITSLEELIDNVTQAIGDVAEDAGKRAGEIYASGFETAAEDTVNKVEASSATGSVSSSTGSGSETDKTNDNLEKQKTLLDKVRDAWKKFTTAEEEGGKSGYDAVNDITDAMSQLLDSMSDFFDQMYENQASALEASLETAKENGDLTVEEEKEMQEEINALRKKQFEANKKNEIAQATIEGAMAIMKIWAEYASQPAIASVLTALTGATTAMEIATISSQQYTGYEQGGLVKGRGITGDNNLIWANAGELVLTRAQQANLASQLNSNNGGGTINIDFSGNVFGDRQSIAEYVYDAIMTAQNNGAIGQW